MSTLRFEALEPRILYSADVALLLGAAGLDAAAEVRLLPPAQQQQAAAREIVFVDARVPDALRLTDDLLRQRSAGREVEVVTLNAGEDGVAQIGRVLAGERGLAAVHVISHGSSGEIDLGSTRLDGAALAARASAIAAWGSALAADGDLLLYGCDVAGGSDGRAFVQALARLTAADVAASDNLTGAAAAGADWRLEFATGAIEAAVAPGAAAQAAWQGVLDSNSFRDGVSGYASTVDTYIDRNAPNTSQATNPGLYVADGFPNDRNVLIRFDNLFGNGAGQIPFASTITAATLTVNVIGTDNFSTVSIRQMLVNWNDNSTWNSLGSGVSADNSEAGVTALSTISTAAAGAQTFTGLAASLQTVADGGANHGWLIDTTLFGANSWGFSSSEWATVASRPQLNVTYTPPQPPVIDLDANNSSGATGSGFNGAFTEGGGAVPVADSDATLTDSDSATLASLTVSITNRVNGSAETLSANTAGTAISASFDSANGVLSLSGSDTVAHYQQVMRTVAYDNSADEPTDNTRSISFVASDGVTSSASAVTTLTVTQTDDAPTQLVLIDDAATNLVSNGSFETNSGAANSPNTGVGITVAGWTATGGEGFEVWNNYNNAPFPGPATASDGVSRLELDVLTALNGVTQNVTTQASQSYLLSFDFAHRANGNAVSGVDVYWRGSLVGTVKQNTVAWQTYRFVVTGSGGADALAFVETADTNEGTGSHLDNVRLFAIQSPAPAVPENAANGTAVGSAAALDPDGGDGFIYSLTDSSAGRFAINASSGLISVADGSALDHETATSRNITVRATDSGGLSRDQVFMIGVTDVNEPIVALPDSAIAVEASGTGNGTPGTDPSGNVLANDADPDAGDNMAVTGVAAGSVGSASGNVGSAVAGSYGSVVVAANGAYTYAVDNANPAVQALHDSSTTLTDTFTYTVRDAGGLASSTQLVVTISGGNDAPVLAGTGAALAYTENDAASAVAPGLTVSDPDSATLYSASIGVSAGYASAEDVLAFVNQNGISGSWNAGTGVLTLTGAASVANYQAALRSVSYANTSEAPSTATRTLAFTVNDGSTNSNTVTRSVTVAAVNDLPVSHVPASVAASEDTPVALTGFSVSDPDAGSDMLQTTLSAASGTLAASAGGGVTVNGSGTGAVTLRGTLADLNAYLGGALRPSFLGAADANGTVALTMVTGDGQNSGSGGALAAGSFDYRFQDGTPPSSNVDLVPSTGGITGVTNNFNVNALAAALTGSTNSFGIIFSGIVDVTTAGSYSFSVTSDDAARLRVDGVLVANSFFNTATGSAVLAAGRHAIELRYYNDAGGAVLNASYAGADTGGSATSLLSAAAVGRLVGPTAASTINVAAVNDAPVITNPNGGAPTALAVAENTTAATTVTSSDVDGGTPVYSIAGGADAARFLIDATTGVLRFATAPDFESPVDVGGNNVYGLIVQVSDGSATDTQAIAVTVSDVSNTLVVSTTADTSDGDTSSIEALNASPGADGRISLREAITAANQTANGSSGADRITFNITDALVGGAHTIALASMLPTVSDALLIDAATEPDWATHNAPVVVLNGGGSVQDGLRLGAGSSGSTVRGLVIQNFSGNGIDITSSGNTIAGNYLGTTASGAAAAGNQNGINIVGGSNNLIGGLAAADRNLISGNSNIGVNLFGGADGTRLLNNDIGLGAAGNALGNGVFGLFIRDSVGTVVGGGVANAGNRIANSGSHGVVAFGGAATGHVLLGNSITGNGGGGINLASDANGAANHGQNSLLLTSATTTGSQLRVNGSLTGAANTFYRVELYANTLGDPSGFGEGQTYLGFVNVPVGASGSASGSYSLNVAVAAGATISTTVTRTDASYTSFVETSGFSNNVLARTPGIVVTPPASAQTTEAGGSTSFSVVLNAAPTADVTIPVASSNPREATASTTLLTFTAANWNVAQTVTVVGTDDTLDDGDRAVTIVLGAASSADAAFDGLNPADVALTNLDDDDRNTVAVTTTDDTADGDTSSLAALWAAPGADGRVSLREALLAANNTANGSGGADRIVFNIPDALVGGRHTVYLASALPAIGDALFIDATPVIALDGSGAGAAANGLTIASAGSLVQGLRIIGFGGAGIVVTGAGATGNALLGNLLSSNGGLGIDLGADGTTANDPGDIDSGPNGLQNTPLLASASANGSNTTVSGTLNSAANASYRIEFFASPGSGSVYLGFTEVTTDGAGNAAFSTVLGGTAVAPSSLVTATATRKSGPASHGGTSEFAAAVLANTAPGHTLPAAQTVAEDTPLAITGLAVADAEGNLASTRLTVGHGTLTVGTAGGAVISAGANGSASLTLAGTQAQINAALATLSYTGDANFNGSDALLLLSTDALGASRSDSVALTVLDVNDAPVIVQGAQLTLAATDEDTPTAPASVASLLASGALGYADADAGALRGLAVFSTAGRGRWQYSTDGIGWADVTGVSASHALLLAAAAQLRYVPDGANGESGATASLGFRAWDGSSGTASTTTTPAYATPGAGGGSTAFSTAAASLLANVASVNDAPQAVVLLSPAAVELAASSGVADLGGAPNGSTQTIGTGAGQLYLLSFDVSNQTGGANAGVDVFWRGSRIATIDQAAAGWQRYRLLVNGSGGADALSFVATDASNGSAGLLLGNVRLVASAAPALAVAENSGNGSHVANAVVIDRDFADGAIYKLVDSAGGRFAIDAASGALRVADGSALDFEAASGHSVTVRVTDGGGLSVEQVFSIAVTDVNEAAVAVPDAATATEAGGSANAAPGSDPSGNVLANDRDPDAGDGLTVAGVAAGPQAPAGGGVGSAVTGRYGSLTLAADGSWHYMLDNTHAAVQALRDASATLTDSFSYTVRDAAGLGSSSTLTVTVRGADDAPVLAVNTGLTVAENSAGTPITAAMLSATDVDDPATRLRFTLNAAPVHGSLSLAGVLLAAGGTFTQADIDAGRLTYDHDGSETTADGVGFSVDDGSGTASAGSFAISITPVNDHAPVFTRSAAVTVAENGVAVTTVSATDVDSATLQYAIAGGADAARFSIDAATGELRFITAPDHDAPGDADGDNVYQVLVSASDGALLGTQAIAVTVADVNEAPDAGPAPSFVTDEDQPLTGNVLSAATDPDGDALSALWVSGPAHAAAFALHADGTFSYTPAADFFGSDSFSFAVSDGAFTSATITVGIDVRAVDDAPVIVSDGAVTVVENTRTVTTVSAVDADSAGAIVYAIAGGADAARFRIDAATGALGFTTAPDFETPADAAGRNRYAVLVSASSGGLSAQQSISVTVVDGNDAPNGRDATLALAEDGAWVFAPADFGFHDADDGDALGALRIDALPAAGRLTLAGAALQAGQVIAAEDIAALQFTPGADANGSAYASLRFSVADLTGTWSDGSHTLSFDVAAVNDAPQLVANSGFTVAENSVGNLVSAAMLAVADVDAAASALVYTLTTTPAHGMLRLGGVLLAAGDTFTQADIDAARLGYDHDGSEASPDGFAFSLDDGAGGTLAGAVAIAVTPVDDQAPRFTGGNGFAVAENGTAVTTLQAVDDDLPAAAVTYRIVGGADAARFTLDAATGVLAFATAPDFEAPADAGADNVYDVWVEADDGSHATQQRLQIGVAGVNEAPTAADVQVGATEDTPRGFSAADLGFADLDAGDTLGVLHVHAITGGGHFVLAGPAGPTPLVAGQTITAAELPRLLFVPDANANGARYAMLTLRVEDAAGRAAAADSTLTINLAAVDDAPALGTVELLLPAGTPLLLSAAQFTASDVDSAELSFIVSEVHLGRFEALATPGVAITEFSQADVLAGRVRFVALAAGALPSFRVAVSDGQQSSASVAATIAFAPVLPVETVPTQAMPEANVAAAAVPDGRVRALNDGGADRSAGEGGASRAVGRAGDTPAGGADVGASEPMPAAAESDALAVSGRPAAGAASTVPAERSRRNNTDLPVPDLVVELLADDGMPLSMLAPQDLGGGAARAGGRVGAALGEPGADDGGDSRGHATLLVQAVQAAGAALTAGSVWWALRAGGLVASLLVVLPAWRHVDLLAVLPDEEDDDPWERVSEHGGDDEAARDEQAVRRVFEPALDGAER